MTTSQPSSNGTHGVNTPITFGDHVFLQSHFNKFLCVNNFGRLACNRDFGRDWEQFIIVQAGDDPAALGQPIRYNDLIHLRAKNNKYITATDAGKARCTHKEASAWETFIITSPMGTLPDDDRDNFDSVIYNSSHVAFHSTSHLTFLSPTKTGKIRANLKGPPGPEQCFKLQIVKRYTPGGTTSPLITPVTPSDPFAGKSRRSESNIDFLNEDSDDEDEYDYSSPLANFPSFSHISTSQFMKRQFKTGMVGNVQRYTKQAAQILMIDHMSSFPSSQQKLKYVKDVCDQNAQSSQSKRQIFTTAEIIAIVETFPVMMYRMEALQLLCTRMDTSARNVLYFTPRELISLIRPYTMSRVDRFTVLQLCSLGFNNPTCEEVVEILEKFHSQFHRLDVIKLICKIEPEQDETYIINDAANFTSTVLEYEQVMKVVDMFDTFTHKKQVVNYLAQSKRFSINKVEIETIVKLLTQSITTDKQ
jgi:hypothetical protein